ncbi:PIN domain-containing protein [Crocosphaera sp.]|uniref:PIN domain-containing protein n=1 Tax=Crocosphaera sp. TaxID=2729996 RepID=UPI003F23EA8F|nr:PIN domain-containing protein [Crocosphaera sp.]
MDDVQKLLNRYRNKGIVIDTNILLLLIVGTANRKRISQFKRTQQFLPEDYDLLIKLINLFPKIIITPNILTEVNSLTNQIGEPERSKCFAIFAQLISEIEEIALSSQEIVKNNGFIKFGLTDCGILELSQNQYLVLTDDFKLFNYLQKLGIDSINFNYLRVYLWQ